MNDYITIAVLATVLLIAAAWGWREERREKRRRNVIKRLNEQYLEGVHPKYKNHDFLKEM